MFSSFASYLFGSNTPAIANSETTAETILSGEANNRDSVNLVDADNLIEVTSLTPSVTGASGRGQQQQERTAIKRGGKNKRNNTRQQNKRKGITNKNGNAKAKLLTTSDSCDEDFNEDEWYIVEKEDDEEENDSPSRTDSERENTPVNEIVKTVKPTALTTSSSAQQRRLQHINSHSLYSGPRPQKQRNYLQKTRSNNNSRSNGLSVSTLSPSRTVNEGRNASGFAETADGGITRSLYVASATAQHQQPESIKATPAIVGNVIANVIVNADNKMDESWFVTPPPCFTSIGPISMETSPYENLLIEHPSMSVYHSIKLAQEATESFIKLDISVNEKLAEKRQAKESQRKNTQAVQQRSSGYRLDRQSVAQLKQELLARTVQKTQSKMDHKDLCRSAIKRSNKVRDVQSKNHIQRRSDRQYSNIVSNANNNRRTATCY